LYIYDVALYTYSDQYLANPAVSLQPLHYFLASKHASENSENTTFDAVAGSVLAEYAGRRDEREERHERDELASSLAPVPIASQFFLLMRPSVRLAERGDPIFSFPRQRRQISLRRCKE